MDDTRQHGDGRGDEAHSDSVHSVHTGGPSSNKVIVYSCFPGIGNNLGSFSEDNIIYYDVGRTPESSLITFLDGVPASSHGFDASVRNKADVYFTNIGVWRDGNILPSTDSEVITHMLMWVLSRSNVVLIDIDNTFCPEIWLASNIGIPVIGVSTRYAIYPVLDAVLTAKIQPNIDVIKRTILALGGR